MIILLHFYPNFKKTKRTWKILFSALFLILLGVYAKADSIENKPINIADKCSIIFDLDTTYILNPIINYDEIKWNNHPFKLFSIQSQQYQNEFVIKYEFIHLTKYE